MMTRPIARVCVGASLVWLFAVGRPAGGQEARSSPPSSEASVEPQTEAQLIALVRGLWDAVDRRDSVAVVEMVDPGALFVTTGVRKDRTQLMADFAPWVGRDSGSRGGLRLEDFRVMTLSDDAAIVSYVLQWDPVDPRIPSRMYDSQVWARRGDRWVLVFAHDSIADLMEFLRSTLERGGPDPGRPAGSEMGRGG